MHGPSRWQSWPFQALFRWRHWRILLLGAWSNYPMSTLGSSVAQKGGVCRMKLLSWDLTSMLWLFLRLLWVSSGVWSCGPNADGHTAGLYSAATRVHWECSWHASATWISSEENLVEACTGIEGKAQSQGRWNLLQKCSWFVLNWYNRPCWWQPFILEVLGGTVASRLPAEWISPSICRLFSLPSMLQ